MLMHNQNHKFIIIHTLNNILLGIHIYSIFLLYNRDFLINYWYKLKLKNIDLYTVLCNCDKTKNQGDGITRIRLNTNSPLPWHKEIVYQLQMKRSDVVAITIPERGLEDKRTVIVANSTKQRRNR